MLTKAVLEYALALLSLNEASNLPRAANVPTYTFNVLSVVSAGTVN